MKCARSKKRSQNISSNYVQSGTSKFNCSKVTLMKFRNSLFANVKLFNKQQRNQSEKCLKLSVSYSSTNENLTISGVTFSSDGRRKSFIRTSIQSEFDDYSRLETERKSSTLPWSVPQKSKTNCNLGNSCNNTDPDKLLRSGDVESNPGPTPTNAAVKASGRPKKKTFPSESTGKSYAEAVAS